MLPFANLSADIENEYFSDGLAEDLINALTKLKGLRVAARTSSFRFKGRNEDIREIGRKLDAGAVLEGSVRRAGKRLRITAQLINTTDGYHLWSEQFDREMEDVFAVQDEITASIVKTLEIRLAGPSVEKPKPRRPTANLEAYDHYLKGRERWRQRTPTALEIGIKHFKKAIELDPSYALAYTGLADCHSLRRAYGAVRRGEIVEECRAAANRGLELDSTLSQAHFSVGLFKVWLEKDWTSAGKDFERAPELDPDAELVHAYYAIVLQGLGLSEKAEWHANRVEVLDPLGTLTRSLAGASFLLIRQYERALSFLERALEHDPEHNMTQYTYGLTLSRLGKHEQAIAVLERVVRRTRRTPLFLGMLGFAYQRAGGVRQAHALLDEFAKRSRREYVLPLGPLFVHAGGAEVDPVVSWLEKCKKDQSPTTWLQLCVWPELEAFSSDPRISDLLKRLQVDASLDSAAE